MSVMHVGRCRADGGEAILGFAVCSLTAQIAARLGFDDESVVVLSWH